MFMHTHLHFVNNLSPLYHRMVLRYERCYNLLLHLTEHQHTAMFLFLILLGKLLFTMLFLTHKSYHFSNLLYPMHMFSYSQYHIHHLIVLLQYMFLQFNHLVNYNSMNYFLQYLGM